MLYAIICKVTLQKVKLKEVQSIINKHLKTGPKN